MKRLLIAAIAVAKLSSTTAQSALARGECHSTGEERRWEIKAFRLE